MSGIDDGRHNDVARRLTAGLRGAGDDGGLDIDVESIARVGALKLRRRRNFTAAGVAAGVVVLVVGGTIIGRPAPMSERSAGSGPVPVCVAKTTDPMSWGWDYASSTDEGSSTESTVSSPHRTAVAGPSGVSSALSAAESRAVSSAAAAAASSAQVAAAAAASSAQFAAAAAAASHLDVQTPVSAAPSSVTEIALADGMTISRPSWYSTPKQLQLNGALRAAIPSAVKVLDGLADGIGFADNSGIQGVFQLQVVQGTGNPNVPIIQYSVGPDQIAYPSSTLDGTQTVTASGAIFKPNLGWGTLSVDVTKGKPGPPTCSDGPIQRRITEPDRTILDVSVVRTTPDLSGQNADQEVALRVTAYRPDGTIVTAEASTNGTAAQLPMTADELAKVATAPGLDVSTAPNAADSSSAAMLTTDQSGNVSTRTPLPSAATASPAPITQASPTH